MNPESSECRGIDRADMNAAGSDGAGLSNAFAHMGTHSVRDGGDGREGSIHSVR